MKTNDLKMKTLPSADFIRTLKELTDANEHTEVSRRIANWCIAQCGDMKFEGEWHRELPPWQYFMNIFRMFHEMFISIKHCHLANSDFPFGDLRYEISKRMEDTIERVFGKETLEALQEGGR